MIGELTDQIVMPAKLCVPEKRVGRGLQQLLPLRNAPALVDDAWRH